MDIAVGILIVEGVLTLALGVAIGAGFARRSRRRAETDVRREHHAHA